MVCGFDVARRSITGLTGWEDWRARDGSLWPLPGVDIEIGLPCTCSTFSQTCYHNPEKELEEHKGEILIRAPSCFLGYLATPDTDVWTAGPRSFFRTGDIGELVNAEPLTEQASGQRPPQTLAIIDRIKVSSSPLVR